MAPRQLHRTKKLPPHSHEAWLPAHAGEAKKPFVIAIVVIIGIIILSLLLFSQRLFVGKAFTGLPYTAGIEDPGVMMENQPFSLNIEANIGSQRTVAISFDLDLPAGIDCSDIIGFDTNVEWDTGDGAFSTEYDCDNIDHKVLFEYSTLDINQAVTGFVPLLTIYFDGLPAGEYDFQFSNLEIISADDALSSDYDLIGDGLGLTLTVASSTPTPDQVCGDGTVDGSETCDDGDDTIDGDGCSSNCDTELGWICTGEPSVCSFTALPGQVCGNNIVEGTEQCDGNDLNGVTCASLFPGYYGGGVLRCQSNCAVFDSQLCTVIDTDSDGINDGSDNCPFAANPDQADSDNDGIGDPCETASAVDSDNDGVSDALDLCPDTPAGTAVNTYGCPVSVTAADTDSDGINDGSDNCPFVANLDQADSDGDGIGDACETASAVDSDNDGVSDALDLCPDTLSTEVDAYGCPVTIESVTDTDGDGIPDVADPDMDGDGIVNILDPDTDGDGELNTTDPDDDNDGIPDTGDSSSTGIGTDTDYDGDGIANTADPDLDGDGVANILDPDTDGDGIPNTTDPDDDNDGIIDTGDSNSTGLGDADDTDGDGTTNDLDSDIDGDGVVNILDPDTDGDGIPNTTDSDDDNDGILDVTDSTSTGLGDVNDLDGDGISNAADPDVDGDGMPNDQDSDMDGDGIANNQDADMDGDGQLNNSDPDTDGDGIPNTTDSDDDNDGIPDTTDTSIMGFVIADADNDGVDDAVDQCLGTPIGEQVDATGCKQEQTARGGGGSRSSCTANVTCSPYSFCNSTLQQARTCVDYNGCQPLRTEVISCSQCKESWICSVWANCQNGVQTRSCIDEHGCGTLTQKPSLQKSCQATTAPGPQPRQVVQNLPPPQAQQPAPVKSSPATLLSKYLYYIVGALAFVAMAIIGLVVLSRRHKHKAYNFNDLKDWIQKEESMGTSHDDIQQILSQETGWTADEVSSAFKELHKNEEKNS